MNTTGSPTDRIRVAVIYGGRSSEHSVSCVSAGAVMAHLDTNKYEVIPVGISLDGAWMVGESDPEKLTIVDRTLPKVEPRDQVPLYFWPPHG